MMDITKHIDVINNENVYTFKECREALEYFICNNLINKDLILKYRPFNLWHRFASESTYQYIINKFGYPKYCAFKAIVMAGYNNVYFNNKVEPEIEIFRTAAKCANKLVYLDQLEKAKTSGYFYKYLDMENEQVILHNPEKIPLSEVNFELEFDYKMYLPK